MLLNEASLNHTFRCAFVASVHIHAPPSADSFRLVSNPRSEGSDDSKSFDASVESFDPDTALDDDDAASATSYDPEDPESRESECSFDPGREEGNAEAAGEEGEQDSVCGLDENLKEIRNSISADAMHRTLPSTATSKLQRSSPPPTMVYNCRTSSFLSHMEPIRVQGLVLALLMVFLAVVAVKVSSAGQVSVEPRSDGVLTETVGCRIRPEAATAALINGEGVAEYGLSLSKSHDVVSDVESDHGPGKGESRSIVRGLQIDLLD